MLTEFDQNTIANMTAALVYVCKKIPADRDSSELRKQNCGRTHSMCPVREAHLNRPPKRWAEDSKCDSKDDPLQLVRS
jgi:hypothetical protein